MEKDEPWVVTVVDATAGSRRGGRNVTEIWPNGASARTRYLVLELELGLEQSVKSTTDWYAQGFAENGLLVVEVTPGTVRTELSPRK
jgi:hypothetical protein